MLSCATVMNLLPQQRTPCEFPRPSLSLSLLLHLGCIAHTDPPGSSYTPRQHCCRTSHTRIVPSDEPETYEHKHSAAKTSVHPRRKKKKKSCENRGPRRSWTFPRAQVKARAEFLSCSWLSYLNRPRSNKIGVTEIKRMPTKRLPYSSSIGPFIRNSTLSGGRLRFLRKNKETMGTP